MPPSLAQQDRTADHKEKRDEVQRLVRSPLLHGSEALCHLLQYLAEHALETPQIPTKEYQIATEVFGRPTNFDPRLDSTVRVQTSRLRSKLAEYYATVGTSDTWQIEIPKGSYSLVFRERATKTAERATPQPAVEAPSRIRPVLPEGFKAFLWLLSGAALASLLFLFFRPARNLEPASPAATLPSPLVNFWQTAVAHNEPPLVVFSNAEFVGRPETGLRYRRPNESVQEGVFDHYTGVGEVIAIHALDELFERLGRKFTLKRGRLLNWDDTKERDLIFVGSPSENEALRELPLNRDFAFERAESGPRRGDLGIRNLHPRAGEEDWYFDSPSRPMTEDYALIELSNAASATHRMLLLAGTNTFGTQGAVEFVCREDKTAALMAALNHLGQKHLNSMAVLLRVRVQGGVPLDSEIVALRRD
ncbi:MAG TPA: hypothetical protein VH325_16430 [Bryobacteraceae bacterium]|jgi:hypothetical protein|nr:hypothetical protein [Bryobacteraceae bacterium]